MKAARILHYFVTLAIIVSESCCTLLNSRGAAASGSPCTPGKRPRSPLKDAQLLFMGGGAAEGSDDAAVDNVRGQKRYLSEARLCRGVLLLMSAFSGF